jgi:membrane protease YdiL (CAAX protease family)
MTDAAPGAPAPAPSDAAAGPARWPLGSTSRLVHGLALTVLLAGSFPVMAIAASLFGVDLEQGFTTAPSTFAMFATVSGYRVAVVAIGIVVWGKVDLRALGWTGEGMRRSVGLGVAGAALAIAVTALVAILAFGESVGQIVATVGSFTIGQRLLFVMIGLDAGFTEESLFRGYLQPTLVRKLGFPGGLLVTAIVFGLYHLKLRPAVLVGKVVLGLVFGLLRGQDRPLWVSAIAHALLWVVVGFL